MSAVSLNLTTPQPQVIAAATQPPTPITTSTPITSEEDENLDTLMEKLSDLYDALEGLLAINHWCHGSDANSELISELYKDCDSSDPMRKAPTVIPQEAWEDVEKTYSLDEIKKLQDELSKFSGYLCIVNSKVSDLKTFLNETSFTLFDKKIIMDLLNSGIDPKAGFLLTTLVDNPRQQLNELDAICEGSGKISPNNFYPDPATFPNSVLDKLKPSGTSVLNWNDSKTLKDELTALTIGLKLQSLYDAADQFDQDWNSTPADYEKLASDRKSQTAALTNAFNGLAEFTCALNDTRLSSDTESQNSIKQATVCCKIILKAWEFDLRKNTLTLLDSPPSQPSFDAKTNLSYHQKFIEAVDIFNSCFQQNPPPESMGLEALRA